MDVIILAAGLGTRLRPLTNQLPKSLVPIHGKPLLWYILSALPVQTRSIILVCGYLGHQIKETFGQTFQDWPIHYVTQTSYKGSGDALMAAKDSITNEPFMVLHGDNLYRAEDLTRLAQASWAMGLAQEIRPSLKLAIRVDDKELIHESFTPSEAERETPLWICTGAYMFDQMIFTIPPVTIRNGELGLPQTMLLSARTRPIQVVHFTNWYEVNTLDELAQIEKNPRLSA